MKYLTNAHFWILKILITLAAVVILHILLKLFVKFVKSRSIVQKFSWKDKIDYILLKPAHFLIWILAIVYIIGVLASKFNFEKVLIYIHPLRNSLIVVCLTWFLMRWKKVFEEFLIKKEFKRKIDTATIDFIGKLVSIVIVFVSLLIVLQFLGVDIMPLIAFGGVGAASIGFAGKDVIANFFGGLMVYITKPFRKGDLVEIPKDDILGYVEKIGWYLTSIRNMDKCPIYVPNSIFSTAQIRNYTRRSHRKMEFTIGIRYKDFQNLNNILEDVKKALADNEHVDSKQSMFVYFTNFGHYSLDIFIRAYVSHVNYSTFMEIREKFLMKFNDIIKSYDASVPFPTTTVELEKSL